MWRGARVNANAQKFLRTTSVSANLRIEVERLSDYWRIGEHKEVLMSKKYEARLSDEERVVCRDVVKKLKGTSQKVKRTQMLLDADGPGWCVCLIRR